MCREVVLDYVDPGEGVCYRLLRSVSCLQQLHHQNIVPLVFINLEPQINKVRSSPALERPVAWRAQRHPRAPPFSCLLLPPPSLALLPPRLRAPPTHPIAPSPRPQLRLFYEDVGHPLEEELKNGRLPLPHVREVLRQILIALAHCHCQGITHRNLKPKYVLLRRTGGSGGSGGSSSDSGGGGSSEGSGEWQVKLSDFNSVRWLGVQRHGGDEPLYGASDVAGACSPTVVTQPYRAPEILLGCTSYNTSIDIWACGCVFAEMASATILFAGDSDIGQLIRIFELLGTPGPEKPVHWRKVEDLPYYNPMFPAMRPKNFADHPSTKELCASPAAEDLLRRMLQFDPAMRITAAEALEHPFFSPDRPSYGLPPPSTQSGAQQPTADATPIARSSRKAQMVQMGEELASRKAQMRQLNAAGGAQEAVDSELTYERHHKDLAGFYACMSGGPDFDGGGSSKDAAAPSSLRTPIGAAGGSAARFSPIAASGSASGNRAAGSGGRPCVWDMWRTIESSQRGPGGMRPSAKPGASFSATELMQYTCHREVALQWILKSALDFCKCDRTVHLAVAILDHVCQLRPAPSSAQALTDGSGSWVELLGIAALLLACKFQEVEIHMVDEFVYHANARYESADVLDAEVRICSALRLDFAIPSSLDFLYCLLHRLSWPTAFAVHRGMHKPVVMLAQLLCELSLLSTELAMCRHSSLVASCSLCLSLACLRCGVWRDGSPGPSTTPEQYWTASMVQATGYTRADLRGVMGMLRAVHEQAAPSLSAQSGLAPVEQVGRWGAVRRKFSQPRFLGVLRVLPFSPHHGGALYSPLHADLVRTALPNSPVSNQVAAALI